MSHSLYAYDRTDSTSAEGKCTPHAIQIATSFWGSYTDVQGKLKSVGGDMTKLWYVPGLSPAPQMLIKHISCTARRNPSTQEIRIMMICANQAYRIRYGTPIVVTFSPDEGHNLFMIR